MQKSPLLVDDNGAISQDLENYLLKRTYTHFVVKTHFNPPLAQATDLQQKNDPQKPSPFRKNLKDQNEKMEKPKISPIGSK